MAVLFEQQPAGEFDAVAPIEGPPAGSGWRRSRLDDAVAGAGFGEGLAQVGGEAGEPGGGGGHIVPGEPHGAILPRGGSPRIEPGHRGEGDQRFEQGKAGDEPGNVVCVMKASRGGDGIIPLNGTSVAVTNDKTRGLDEPS
jgi:hypothetical protein